MSKYWDTHSCRGIKAPLMWEIYSCSHSDWIVFWSTRVLNACITWRTALTTNLRVPCEHCAKTLEKWWFTSIEKRESMHKILTELWPMIGETLQNENESKSGAQEKKKFSRNEKVKIYNKNDYTSRCKQTYKIYPRNLQYWLILIIFWKIHYVWLSYLCRYSCRYAESENLNFSFFRFLI